MAASHVVRNVLCVVALTGLLVIT
ncbi:MAG: hypothetical protein JWO86_5234, partial [Myxococcaceae bacterium]|nr:hypothetical protein [Myxococcaceae bacterium]